MHAVNKLMRGGSGYTPPWRTRGFRRQSIHGQDNKYNRDSRTPEETLKELNANNKTRQARRLAMRESVWRELRAPGRNKPTLRAMTRRQRRHMWQVLVNGRLNHSEGTARLDN